MKKEILIIIVIAFNCLNSYSQFYFPKQKEAIEFKRRILLVQLREEDSDILKEFSKDPDAKKNYKGYIEYYNKMMQDIFPEYWELNDKILFKKSEEIENLIKTDKEKYSVFISKWELTSQKLGTAYQAYDVFAFTGYYLTKKDKYVTVKYISLPSGNISTGDLIFVIHQFNSYINTAANGGNKKDVFFDIDKNLEILKNKILLLDTNMLKVKDKQEISEVYPNKYKLTSNIEIEKAILQKDKRYAYFTLIWSYSHQYYIFVVPDTENGHLLSKVGTGGVNINIGFIPTGGFGTGLIEGRALLSYRSVLSIKKGQLRPISKKGAQKVANLLKKY